MVDAKCWAGSIESDNNDEEAQLLNALREVWRTARIMSRCGCPGNKGRAEVLIAIKLRRDVDLDERQCCRPRVSSSTMTPEGSLRGPLLLAESVADAPMRELDAVCVVTSIIQ